jgi:quercetin dioxygenase-like cupin family protein
VIVKKLQSVPREAVALDGVQGAWKQLVLGDADGVPNFSFRVFTLEPGGHTPRHAHETEHLNLVISGRGVLVAPDGEEKPLDAGDFAFVPPEELHQFRNAGEAPFVFLCAVPKRYE